MEVKFDTTPRKKVVFWYLQAAHVCDFLLVIHIDGLYQCMSPTE